MSDNVTPLRVFERRSRYRVERFDEIVASSSPQLVKGMLPMRGLAFYAGASKAGKTFVCLDHMLKIASGASVMGRKAKQRGIIYVAAEDPDGCRARVHAWKKKYPRESYTPFVLIGQRTDLNDPGSVDDLKGAIRDAVAEFAEMDFLLGAIVFDTMAQCLPGADENSSADMGGALGVIQGFGEEFATLAVVVAHHGKNAQAGIRGWSGMGAAADAVITVVRDEETKERTLTLDKVKNGPDGDCIAFSLDRAPIGVFDEDGEEIWSCTVTYEGLAERVSKSPKVVALKPAEELMLSAVRWVTDNGSTQDAPMSIAGVRPGTKAVRTEDVYSRVADAGLKGEGETHEAYRKRRRRALEALAAAKRIRIEGDLLWLV
jgi:hypothetical protein